MSYLMSSIGKKQIVAVTGLMLVMFLVGHLFGNLFIYLGPEAFNAYAHKLISMRPALYVVEFGLLAIFLVHVYFTYLVVMGNIKARGDKYKIQAPKKKRSLATRLMPFTGSILLLFVIKHLLDFTLFQERSASTFVNGVDMEVYGRVFNTFQDPIHSLFYVVAMMCVGFHLTHGVQSCVHTFGFNHPKYTPLINKASLGLGVFIAVAFSSIPIYMYLK